MKTHAISALIRIPLTVWLLIVIWHHAHWSVALALTSTALEMELIAIALHVTFKILRERL